MVDGVVQAVAQLAGLSIHRRHGVQFAGAHPRQGHQGRGVGQGVDRKRIAGADRGYQRSAHGRADQAAELEHRGIDTDRVAQLVRADHFIGEGLPGGIVDGGDESEAEGDQVHLPGGDLVRQGRRGQGPGYHGQTRLGGQQDPALGVTIGDQPAYQTEQQGRDELQRCRDPDIGGAAGEAKDEPVLGNSLHPGAGVRAELGYREKPEISCSQGTEGRAVDGF